jgi:hypothetical protein
MRPGLVASLVLSIEYETYLAKAEVPFEVIGRCPAVLQPSRTRLKRSKMIEIKSVRGWKRSNLITQRPSRNCWIRKRKPTDSVPLLLGVGRADEAWTVVAAAPHPPGSFAELLERLDEGALPGVVFTGEVKNVLELDEYDPLGTWASKAWDMLRVLDGYADARRAGVFTQGVHAYLSQTLPGRPSYSPGSHASQESESVQQSSKFSKLRTLPVPPEVDPDGLVFMGAHFKIARKGTISPRIYYYDSTAKTGEVFIGYIGRHLQNTLTN